MNDNSIKEIQSNSIQPRLANLFKYMSRGYNFREIFLKALSLKFYSKILSRLKYSFYHRGKGVDIDHRSIIDGSLFISLGDFVWIQRGTWLLVPLHELDQTEKRPYISIGNGCRIGPNCTISATNYIEIGRAVLLGPNVTILDHIHNYEDISRPVSHQGITKTGRVILEENSWVAANVVICSGKQKLTIGRNSVVAANSMVRHSVEPNTVVSGNPAKIIKRFNEQTDKWEAI